jgi:hypothetical protein
VFRRSSGSVRGLHTALLLAAVGCAPAVTAPPSVPGVDFATRPAITAEDLSLRVGIVAHDSMEGRGLGAEGLRRSARYLASEAQRLGLRPMGDAGTYFQTLTLTRSRIPFRGEFAPAGAAGGPLGPDELRFVGGMGGLPEAAVVEAEGSLIYGGYLADPAVGARALRMDELQGAALMIRLGAPEGVLEAPRMDLSMAFMPGTPVRAVLIVADGEAEQFWDFAEHVLHNGTVSLGAPQASPRGAAFFLVSPGTAERILGRPLDGAREPVRDLGTFRYSLAPETETVEAKNVVAALPGRDQARAGEYVVLGAHYDHLGIGPPVDGDSIFNGADDNASGTTALLEIAERFARGPAAERPARSLLFLWFTAEEHGLLGSEYFTDNPTVPRRSMVTMINLDMVGRNHPDSLFVVGTRRLATELGDLVDAVNARKPQPFILDYTYDAPGHPEMIFCRSDHWSFARHGIPIVYFTTGLHDQYHKPSDRPELLDYAKHARVANFAAMVAAEVGNLAARPRVDQPVPPLGSPCQ